MPDFQQNKPRYQKYRYSIPQLVGLASTALLPFDLSKFSYDAARAGVVPSLGDCAMSSRKSSTSCIRGANLETTSSTDIVTYQGYGVQRPERQPNGPPPAERQKDEGFATFLKKHSSPTHNRVTAGGRIVPMEPRSPPPFSLPANATNRPQVVLVGQQFEDVKKNGNNEWTSNGRVSSQAYLNHLPTERRFLDAVGYAADPSGSPVRAVNVNNAMHNPYETQVGFNNAVEPTTISPQSRAYFNAHHMSGPVMQQPTQAQQCSMIPYATNAMMPAGMGLPVADHYKSAAGWGASNQPYQPYAMQQVMSAHQLLAAWQQHYTELDQQLKNIDRHRAMNQLDHQLAEQRRVIVQQRSDAKDTVRDYQEMLGLKRMTDSSQESFATGFNVEAPAYVPASEIIVTEKLSYKPSLDLMPAMPVIEKPRGSAHRRAIPIVPPPDRFDERRASQQSNADDSTACQTNQVDGWGINRRPAPPTVRRGQSGLSDMMETERQRQMSTHESPPYMPGRKESANSFEGVACNDACGSSDAAAPAVIPAKDIPPRDPIDEYQQMIKALGQPKGTITKLRLLNSDVMDVGGQDLDLSAVPLPSSLQFQNSWSKMDSTQGRGSREGRTSITPAGPAPNDMFVGKENFSVTPKGHQKAATDAFLAQFNAVEDNMALAAKLETQSLRTISNSASQQNGHKVVALHGPDSAKMASTENLAGQMALSAIGADSLQPASAMSNRGHSLVDPATSFSPDSLNNKGYSSVSVQNIHAVGSLPYNFDGVVEGRQSVKAQLGVAGSKTRSPQSPRLLRRHGGNGGA